MPRSSTALVSTSISLIMMSLLGVGCGGDTRPNHDAARDGASPDLPIWTGADLPPEETHDAFVAIDLPERLDSGATTAKDAPAAPDVPQADSADISPADRPVGGSTETGNADSGSDTVGKDATSSVQNKFGFISLMQALPSSLAPANAVFGSGAIAIFGVTLEAKHSCPPTTSGDCQLYQCPASKDASTPIPLGIQAGTVSMTGLATELPLSFNASSKSYYSPSISTPLWTASRTATITVTGSADVPAFSASIVAPNPVSVTSPVAQSSKTSNTGMAYTISRGNSLDVTWKDGVDGTVSVGLGDNNGLSIVCSVDASKAMLTVPAELMAKLGSTGSFSVDTVNTMTKNVDGWLMQFDAFTVKDSGTATFTP